MAAMVLVHRSDLREFFDEELRTSLAAESLQLPRAHAYLVDLCCDFVARDALQGARDEPGPPTLAWLYARAVEGPPDQRLESWRRLGDVALAISGLFAPYLHRRQAVVGPEYYAQMGAAAYASAADLAVRRRVGSLGELFETLARHFRRLVEVLVRLAESTTLPVVREPAALWSRLQADPASSSVLRQLGAQGLSPVWVGSGRA
jgi:hypothetical protein